MPTLSSTDNVEAEIMKTLRRFSRGITTFDPELVLSALDPHDDFLTYQPEERPDALQSRADIARYVKALDQVIGGFDDTKVIETRTDTITEDAAHVYVRFWCRIHRIDGQPLDGQVRQTFVLRRHTDGWFVRHYHESRQIPGFPVIDVKE
ncbi:YybH family protein [Mycolicibacterium sp.]|uniref:YybH family protein n=1 Tax=Mycolicibacterium sp. TaxID=2320850 RepID=UPI0037CC71B7